MTIVSICMMLLIAAPVAAQATNGAPSTQHPPTTKQPFAFASFTWLNGNSRQDSSVLDTKYFTGEFRADITMIEQFNHPSDHTLVGTSESGRTREIQVQHSESAATFTPIMRVAA
jgi:hypothetical protein